MTSRATRTALAVCTALTVALAVTPAVAAPPAKDSAVVIEPVSPIAPVSPISPVTPLDDEEPTRGTQPTGPSGPAGPKPPQGPTTPTLGTPPMSVQEAAARVADLSAALQSNSSADAVPPSPAQAEELIAALRDGRALSVQPASSPQTQVDAQGCPTSAPEGTLREGAQDIGIAQLCADSVAQAATPEAASAIKWALRQLGAPYACEGVGRDDAFRFDCSSLVTRAYYEGAGLATAGNGWSPSTRDLMPWDGVKLAPWAAEVSPEQARPGDLILYRSCTTPPCSFQHVVMLLADGYMLHTNRCGDVAHVTRFTGFDASSGFAVARRVDPEKAR